MFLLQSESDHSNPLVMLFKILQVPFLKGSWHAISWIPSVRYSVAENLNTNKQEFILELDGYTIRKATQTDCFAMHQLAQDFAKFLNMSDAHQICVKDLEEDGFGSRKFYEGFVAESHELNQVVGYAIYYFTYCTWQGKSLYMEDMYIKPEDRKNRIALSFFHLVSRAALKENCKRFNFAVMNTNKPAVKLFQSLGAIDLTEKEGWHSYSIPRFGIEKLAQPIFVNKV